MQFLNVFGQSDRSALRVIKKFRSLFVFPCRFLDLLGHVICRFFDLRFFRDQLDFKTCEPILGHISE